PIIRIVTSVIRCHVRSLCTSAQESCKDARAKNRQQQSPTATLGFHWCFHQMLPFLSSEFPFLFREIADATRVWSADYVTHDAPSANRPNMIRAGSLNRLSRRPSSWVADIDVAKSASDEIVVDPPSLSVRQVKHQRISHHVSASHNDASFALRVLFLPLAP